MYFLYIHYFDLYVIHFLLLQNQSGPQERSLRTFFNSTWIHYFHQTQEKLFSEVNRFEIKYHLWLDTFNFIIFWNTRDDLMHQKPTNIDNLCGYTMVGREILSFWNRIIPLFQNVRYFKLIQSNLILSLDAWSGTLMINQS